MSEKQGFRSLSAHSTDETDWRIQAKKAELNWNAQRKWEMEFRYVKCNWNYHQEERKEKRMKKYEAHKIIFDSLKCTIPRQSNLNACQSIKK